MVYCSGFQERRSAGLYSRFGLTTLIKVGTEYCKCKEREQQQIEKREN